MKKALSLVIFILMSSANAEYRVFQYFVKSSNPLSMDQNSYQVTSTLDPTSFIAYHGGKESLSVDLVRSWMCYGNTAKKQLCAPPLEQMQAKQEE